MSSRVSTRQPWIPTAIEPATPASASRSSPVRVRSPKRSGLPRTTATIPASRRIAPRVARPMAARDSGEITRSENMARMILLAELDTRKVRLLVEDAGREAGEEAREDGGRVEALAHEVARRRRRADVLLEAIDGARAGARHRLEEVAAGRADPAVRVHEDPDADHRGDLLGAGEVARHVGPDLPRDERHDAAVARGLAEPDAHHPDDTP